MCESVRDCVRFTGYRDDVPTLLKAADIIVQPSEFDALPTTLIQALAAGLPTDRVRSLVIAGWLDTPATRPGQLDRYIGAFLTDHRTIRERLITAAAAKCAAADAVAVLSAEAGRVLRFVEARAGAALAEATVAVSRLGAAVLDAYDQQKRLHGQLDYDDLIAAALALLRRPGVAPWVLFKLDGGLDHILIDEAQDTNPEQWAIVAALAEEFFAGEADPERLRTVFAVGDAKQSIFSFQRANPGDFLKMRSHFQERVTAARQDWQVVPLDSAIAESAARLRASLRLKLADAVQLASALAIGADALVTHDRDFSNVRSLRIVS